MMRIKKKKKPDAVADSVHVSVFSWFTKDEIMLGKDAMGSNK